MADNLTSRSLVCVAISIRYDVFRNIFKIGLDKQVTLSYNTITRQSVVNTRAKEEVTWNINTYTDVTDAAIQLNVMRTGMIEDKSFVMLVSSNGASNNRTNEEAFMNRIIETIGKTEKQIAARVSTGTVTQAQVDSLRDKLDMPLDEFISFQELKSIAMMHNKLTFDEATTVYAYLGNSPEHFNSQDIAVKIVLTKVFAELLDWKVKALR